MALKTRTISDGPNQQARRRSRALLLFCIFLLVLLAVEGGRQLGADIPIPFLLIIGTAAVAAALGGMRCGLSAAVLVCFYILWAASNGFGPRTLTGGPWQIALSCLASLIIAALLGYEHDVRSKLLHLLRKREVELLSAKEQLSGKVARTAQHLEKAQNRLSDTRHQMEQAMRFAPIGVVTIDAVRDIQFINDAALAQFGMEKLPDVIVSWNDLTSHVKIFDVNGQRLGTPDGPVGRALTNGASEIDFECRVVGYDGETRWSSGYIGPVRNAQHTVTGVVIMLVDTTIQREVGLALQQLTRMLFKVQEDERSKLSHELHEQIGQSLTAIKFNLYSSLATETGHSDLDASMAQLDALTNNIRQLSLDLRPTSLDDFGLITAIEAFLDRKQVNCAPRLTIDAEDIGTMSDETATVAYRFVQEAVNNAINHAKASLIAVGLSTDERDLHVWVSDNGQGFDVEATRLKAPGSGKLGLLFMQERIRQSGGKLDISTGATTGTSLDVSIPLDFGAEHAENQTGTD